MVGLDPRFPGLRAFSARELSLVQSNYTKIIPKKNKNSLLTRIIIGWLTYVFKKHSHQGECYLSRIIEQLRARETDFLTEEQHKVFELMLGLDNHLRWITFDQLLKELNQQENQDNQTKLPQISQNQPTHLITWPIPTTEELLPLFPRLPSSQSSSSSSSTSSFSSSSSSYKSKLAQNLQVAQQLADQLSQYIDESICARIDSMMLDGNRRSVYDSDEEDDMDVVGNEIISQKLLASRRKPLTPEEELLVTSALEPPFNNTILCEKFKIPMTRSKISCLRPVTWLNDEVINFYLEMLAERDAQLCEMSNSKRLPSHYFNTFFISKLLERGEFTYSNVRRWTRKINLFEKDKVFFPINISDTHWTLAVAYVQQKRVVYYDSMGGLGESYTRAIVDYFIQEGRDKKGMEMSSSEWTREAAIRTHPSLPQQHNGSDCGMFTLMFADFISDNLDLSGFSQSDIKDYRRKVVAAILRGSLNYELIC